MQIGKYAAFKGRSQELLFSKLQKTLCFVKSLSYTKTRLCALFQTTENGFLNFSILCQLFL